MLIATYPHSARARRISVRWPSCSAPIVGTRPMRAPAARACAIRARTSSTVLTISVATLTSLRHELGNVREVRLPELHYHRADQQRNHEVDGGPHRHRRLLAADIGLRLIVLRHLVE